MSSEETKRPEKVPGFKGAWLPSSDPLLIGDNYSTMANLAFSSNGLEGFSGYSKITSTPNGDYPKARSGIQLRDSRNLTLSRIFLHAENAGETASAILQQVVTDSDDDVPNPKDFEDDPIHVDSEGAGLGRFAKWPDNQIAYCNGEESLIYAGDEMPPAVFLVADAPLGDVPVNPVDYTSVVRNDLQTTGNTVPIGTAPDSDTVLLISMTGSAGDAITDYSSHEHGNATKAGTADISPDQSKFGTGSLSTPAGDDGISYADHEDWDPPSTGAMTYEVQHYLSAITNYLTSGSVIFTDNGASPDTIAVSGDQSAVAWLQPGCYIGAEGVGGPWKIASISYSSGPGTTTITLDSTEALSTQTTTCVIAECLSVMGRYQDVSNYWYVYYLAGSGYVFNCVVSGVTQCNYINDDNHAAGWNHVAFLSDGTELYGAVNGVFEQASSGGGAFAEWAAAFNIGRTTRGASSYTGSAGSYFEQCRISSTDRWEENFAPPTTPYRTKALVIIVGSKRPIQGIRPYLAAVNTETGQTVTGKEWTGSDWSPLTITDSTYGLRVSAESIAFPSTVNTSKPRLIEGHVFYFYQFELSGGAAEIYKVTVDAPIQPVRDLWDGVLRPIVSFHERINGGEWIEMTQKLLEECGDGLDADVAFAYCANINDIDTTEFIEVGTSERAMAFRITMFSRTSGYVNTRSSVMSVSTWSGSDYEVPGGIIDGTSSEGRTLYQSGYVSWTPPSPNAEFPQNKFGNTLWRYRISFSRELSSHVYIDKMEYIPAPQLDVLTYAFPFVFQNRPMLCNLTSTGEGNRVDYPATNSTEAWNGSDSTFGDGKSPLYIGGSESLTSACELYSRLGSSLYPFALFFKDCEIHLLTGYDAETYKSFCVDSKIGNPAPLTLDTFTLSDPGNQDSSHNIAAWLSHVGPYMFDAGSLKPIPGIECYFDEDDSRCINYSAIASSVGWFDPTHPLRYNLQIPSGAGQTSPNVWVCYDFTMKRWFPKTPSSSLENPHLGAVIRVSDANKRPYVYGTRDNGHVMRLSHGTTWDGEDIDQYVETGEILPTGHILDTVKMRELLVYAKPLTEERNLIVTLYRNGSETGEVIATIPLQGTSRFIKYSRDLNHDRTSSFRVRFSCSTSASSKGLQLLSWGYKYSREGRDK